MKKKIVILCGFLGSGKTTLLIDLLKRCSGHRVGVLLNDFGEIPVDGTVVREADVPSEAMLEIGGGSIFCACLKDSFVKGLLQLATTPAELLFIEASGMADPAGMRRLLENAHLESEFEHLCTICAFDPIKSMKLSHVLEVIPRQISASDVVCLTKGDLASDEEKRAAKAYIEKMNGRVAVVEDKSDIDVFSVCEEHIESFHFGSFNTRDNRPESFVISRIEGPLDSFVTALEANEKVLRAKGYITCGPDSYYLSDTGRGIEVRASETAPTPLTVICMRGTSQDVQKDISNHGFVHP